MSFNAELALLEALEKSNLRPMQKLRVRLALRYRPSVREEILGAVQMHCVIEGAVTEEGTIEPAMEWIMIIELIIKYLPTILSMFSRFFQ